MKKTTNTKIKKLIEIHNKKNKRGIAVFYLHDLFWFLNTNKIRIKITKDKISNIVVMVKKEK